MKRQLFILLCILFSIKTYSQDTIVSIAYKFPQPKSNFEDRDKAHYFYKNTSPANNIWQIGKPSKTIFNAAYSPTLALITDTSKAYPVENKSSFEFVIYTDDLTRISFWHRMNTDSLNDGGTIEVSRDGGSTWKNILDDSQLQLSNFYSNTSTISSNGNKPGFTGNFGWKNSSINSAFALHYVRFRFTFTSDNVNTNKEGWMIDSFDFTCLGTGVKETPPNSPFHIFPNPASDLISINSDNAAKIKSIEVKNILGKSVLTTDQSSIDLSALNTGIYFMQITSDKGTFVERIQKE